jgi:hypothetical protein
VTGGEIGGIITGGGSGVVVNSGGAFHMTDGEIGDNGGMGVNISGGTVTKTGGGIVYGTVISFASMSDVNFDGSIGHADNTFREDDDYPEPDPDPPPP